MVRTNKIKADSLRRQAETALKKRNETLPADLTADAMPLLIHDLQIHQIELEMQNEELKRTHSELEKSRAKYTDLYDCAPVGYFTLSSKGLILDANLTGAGLLAIKRPYLINKPFISYIEKDDRDAFYLQMRKSFSTGRHQTSELRMKKTEGTQFYAKLESITGKDMEGNDVLRTSLIDITESKNLEGKLLQTQKMESIGTLAGGIAHDFNNLLAAILNYVYLSRNQLQPDHKAYELLKKAESAVIKSTNMTKQLLTFSKGGAPVRETISLVNIIEESVNFALCGTSVIYDVNTSKDLWPVEADSGQVSQVLHNIAVNACQSMPDGGTIHVLTENNVLGPGTDIPLPVGRYVKISISDHGTGVTEEQLQRIFEPYFTTKRTGSGLGLAVCYSIIKNHGGHISVTSSPGMGSTFTLYLPASDKKIVEEVSHGEKPVSGTGRILIMDDEKFVRDSMGAVLTEGGYEVDYATDGPNALEKYKKAIELSHPFNAVLMDLTIPGGMGGKEVIKRLREIDPDVKAVVLSGYSDDTVMSHFSDYGFSDALQKPCRPEKLSEILSNLLRGTSQ
jgi:PAS domain S-box-containing protein